MSNHLYGFVRFQNIIKPKSTNQKQNNGNDCRNRNCPDIQHAVHSYKFDKKPNKRIQN